MNSVAASVEPSSVTADATFEVFYFFGPWCATCPSALRVHAAFASDPSVGAVRCVNVDDDPDLTDRMAIRRIPTFIVRAGGVDVLRTQDFDAALATIATVPPR